MSVLSNAQRRAKPVQEAGMKANGRHVYALHGFTVEKRAKGWFFAPTVLSHEKADWRGPYRSEASVTLVIARELKKEFVRRHRRLAGAA